MVASLQELSGRIRRCRRCERCRTRTRAVPGEGNAATRIVLLGEAPGKDEDKTGRPFVGRSGRYLDGVVGGFGVSREDVFITSILKCYHPGPPRRSQVQACLPWTLAQLEAVRPRVIVVMGLTAARGLLGVKRLRGQPGTVWWQGIRCVVTCHPASAMRFPRRDKQFRGDLERLLRPEL
jgi:uracil-DNA glycosylase family 4